MSEQYFKDTDEKEKKFALCFSPILEDINRSLDQFHDGAYTCFKLGEVLLALKRSPMVGVVSDETFIQSFAAIHQFFTRPGTFEFYLEVFRKIWGDDVEVEFTIPEPGKLEIAIDALSASEDFAMARYIVDNQYFFDELIDHEGDNLIFQTTQGIKTQAETDALLRELHPVGVWVEATLTVT